MTCQILFSEKNKKNVTNLSSAELAQRALKVKVNGRSCKICPHFATFTDCVSSLSRNLLKTEAALRRKNLLPNTFL